MGNNKNKILFVVDKPCFPVIDGSSQRYHAWINYLIKEGYEVYFLSFNRRSFRWNEESISILREYVKDYLIVDAHSNLLFSTFVSSINYIFRIITRKYFTTGFFYQYINKTMHNSIRKYIKYNGVHTLIVNKVETAYLMGLENIRNFHGTKIIDIHDIHAMHYDMANRALKNRPTHFFLRRNYSNLLILKILFFSFNYAKALKEELAILTIFDKILATSIEEYNYLLKYGSISNKLTYLSPLAFVMKNNGDNLNKQSKEYDFGFIAGSGIFNVEAVEYFGKAIIPWIEAENPDFCAVIAGSICAVAKDVLSRHKGFTFLDTVKDLNDFYGKTKVVVVPLLSGTGVSIKTLEAMSFGCPVVSTSAGARGLEVTDGVDIRIEDDPKRFADILIRLIDDEPGRHTMAESAAQTIREKYSLNRYHETLRKIL